MKRSAIYEEALLIAELKGEVVIHRGEAKRVRERVHSTTGRDTQIAAPPRENKQRKGR